MPVAPLHSSWHERHHLCLVKLFTKDSSEAVGKEWRWRPRTLECVGPSQQLLCTYLEGGVLPCFRLWATLYICRQFCELCNPEQNHLEFPLFSGEL